MEVEEDLVEAASEEDQVDQEADSAVEETADSEEKDLKCMMQYVLNVEKIVKFHSDQQEPNLFFAVIASDRKKAEAVAEDHFQEAKVLQDNHLIN